MIGQVEIVVAQIGDIAAAGAAETFVVRPALIPEVALEVEEKDSRILKRTDHGLGIVRTSVADDDDLPIPECRGQDACDGIVTKPGFGCRSR